MNYDVAVIGAGPGGYVAALRAALRGAKTCCIEKSLAGGTCLNVGCIPTKAMLHASELYWHMRHADQYGFSVPKVTVDAGQWSKRVGEVTGGLRKGVEFLFKKRGVELIKGQATLVGSDTISVAGPDGKKEIKARSIILATGSRPAKPGFLPWDSPLLMTTDEATRADFLPKSVLIMGGGVIGCEFATVYSELGIPVTLVEMLPQLVANLDADVAKAVVASLKKRGVDIQVGAKVLAMKAGKNSVTTEVEGGKKFETGHVLVAVGRRTNLEDLGLDKVGVITDKGLVVVDDSCRTSVKNIYAIGDIAELRQYAHLASRMGIIAADNATGHPVSYPREVIPVGIYTHPEAACVGMSEDEAKKSGKKVRTSSFPFAASGMAKAYGETEGLVKIIADEKIGAILGAVVIGQHATDVIQELALAMKNELTVEEIAETIHAHPTFCEAVGESAEAWLGMPLHAV